MFRHRVLGLTTAVVFGASSYAVAQQPAAGAPQQPSSQQTPQRPQTQTQSPSSSQASMANLQSPVRGTLVSVDTDEETFIVTIDQGQSGAASGATGSTGSAQSGAAGAAQSGSAASAQSGAARGAGAMAANQVEFNYDDSTQVTGAEKGIAGLSAMKASRVTVHFVREGGEMKATRIEVQPAGAAAPSASPSATPGSSSTPGSSTPGSTQQPRPQTNPNPDSPTTPQPR